MQTIFLTIHLIVAIALVATILLQRSEGGALGIGGSQGGMFTARGAGDALTKTTKWLAIVFLLNSLFLGWLAANRTDDLDAVTDMAPLEAPAQQESKPTEPEPLQGPGEG